MISVCAALRPSDALVRLDRQARRSIFYLKTDPPVSETRLRTLRSQAHDELYTRAHAIGEWALSSGLGAKAEPMAAGSYHIVHRIVSEEGPPTVARSTISDLFFEDRTLVCDKFANQWMGGIGQGDLVPSTHAVQFRRSGSPFDVAVLELSPWPTLASLGDDVLDEQPAWLFEMGRILREVHRITGGGAGLLDLDEDEAPHLPAGVLDSWQDYIFLNLDQHIAACTSAGYVDQELAGRVGEMFDDLRPLLDSRPLRLLHGDPGTHNVCVDPAQLRIAALLDWEDAVVGDPLFDVAMVSTFQPARRMRAFLAGYGLEAPNREEQILVALYFLRIALSKTVHRFRFGIEDRPGRSPGHHRIYRGVEELERLL